MLRPRFVRCLSTVAEKTSQRAKILSWLDVKDDTGFRGHFVSGEKSHDLEALVENFTAPALARALRDREKLLATCARLLKKEENYAEVKNLLAPFVGLGDVVTGESSNDDLALPAGGLFHASVLNRIRTRLNRMPREITKRARHR